MRKLVLIILLVAGIAFTSNSQGIKFHKDISFKEALNKAKATGKLIFIDAYATWCGPCKYLSNNIFTQSKVGEFYNKNFVNVKIDMEKAPNGPIYDSKLGVRAYPTLVFMNGDGKVVHKVEGAGDANYILSLGETALKKGGKSTGGNTSAKGINFHKDISLSAAMSKAKKEGKLIFIDCFTTWCGPCKYLSNNIFPQKAVGDFYNKNFINVKIDMEKTPNGPAYNSKFGVRAYPTLLFVDANGKLVHKTEGAGDANYILNLGKTALEKGGKPSGNADVKGISFHKDISLSEAMSKAKREGKLIFIDCFTTWCGPCKYLSNNIFPQKAVGDFYNKNFINVKIDMEKTPNGPAYNSKFGVRAYPTLLFVDANGKLVHKTEGAGDANYILNLGKTALNKGGGSGGGNVSNNTDYRSQYLAALNSVTANKTSRSSWNDFVKKTDSYFSSGKANASDLNNGSWFIYENYKTFNDVATLKKAKNWAKKAMQLKPGVSYNIDTYAHIMYALGYINEAVKYGELALQTATRNGDSQDDVNFYKAELAKYKASLR